MVVHKLQAWLSCTLLPNFAVIGYTVQGALCIIWLQHWRGTPYHHTFVYWNCPPPPDSAMIGYTVEGALHIWLHHWRGTPFVCWNCPLPPSPAMIGYIIEGALYIWLHHWKGTPFSTHLSTEIAPPPPPPPNSAMVGYTIEGALRIWLHHWLMEGALRISTHLSTEIAPFLQTLPWLVTLVKDHSVCDYTIGGALCIWLHHWRGTPVSTRLSTEIAPFLQTLPWLVTPSYRVMPLKGHSVSPHICLLKLPLVSTLHNFSKMFEY